MNTQWSTRLHAPEVERLVEDLRRGQVAAEAHLPGRAEGARERAADCDETQIERRPSR
jgi:hypothetical protein